MNLAGIHHVTSLASDPRANVEFYTDVLGLRLVKRTVNFDAPDVYHLYYGDETGRPGTLLTFFPFLNAARGRRGAEAIVAVAFRVPGGSLEGWRERLNRAGVPFDGPRERFGEPVLSFEDPDGMALELVASAPADVPAGWPAGPVDRALAVRRIHGISVLHRSLEATRAFVSGTLGFAAAGSEAARHRFVVGSGAEASFLDVVVDPTAARSRQSAGSFHHVAWRVPDEAAQRLWQQRLRESGAAPTPVIDLQYFHSIYFREPGGVLFEIATDPPGFLRDEPRESLGTTLKLPPWLEEDRERIERQLPPLTPSLAGRPATGRSS